MELPTFADFIASSEKRMTVYEPGIRMYVRRSVFIDGFDLATLDADPPRNGALTRFLNEWEPRASLRIECVLRAWFGQWLIRRGYHHVGESNYVKLSGRR